jgi:excisionase family DNA binding protein
MGDMSPINKSEKKVHPSGGAPETTTVGCPLAGRMATADDVADYLGIDVRTLRRWCRSQSFPQPVRVGRLMRFVGSEVAGWVEMKMLNRPSTEVSHGNA